MTPCQLLLVIPSRVKPDSPPAPPRHACEGRYPRISIEDQSRGWRAFAPHDGERMASMGWYFGDLVLAPQPIGTATTHGPCSPMAGLLGPGRPNRRLLTQ